VDVSDNNQHTGLQTKRHVLFSDVLRGSLYIIVSYPRRHSRLPG